MSQYKVFEAQICAPANTVKKHTLELGEFFLSQMHIYQNIGGGATPGRCLLYNLDGKIDEAWVENDEDVIHLQDVALGLFQNSD